MTRCDKILFLDYVDSRLKSRSMLWFVVVLVLIIVNIVDAGLDEKNKQAIDLKSRSLVEKIVIASPGVNKIIERERVFDSFNVDDGKMQVIVTLDSPDLTTKGVNWKSRRSKQKWQADVAEVQMEVLDRIDYSDIEIRAAYKNFPCFYAAVNSNALTSLMQSPRVKHIEPVRKLKRFLAQGIPLINAQAVRSASGGAGVSIAIIDDGVDYTHPQLGNGGFPNDKVINGIDKADGDDDPYPSGPYNPHGTACAGIAAGDIRLRQPTTLDDYIGGVANVAKIVAVKVFKDAGSGINAYVLDGIDWCVSNQYRHPNDPIKVISMSIGYGKYSSSSQCDAEEPAFLEAVNAAVDAGITVLAAAGNEGYCDSLGCPAALSPVISVGAVYDADIGNVGFCVSSDTCYSGASPDSSCTDPDESWLAWEGSTFAKKVACNSNSASFLDLLAPGHKTYTTDISGLGGYDLGDFTSDFGATSGACPYAAGAVALLQSAAKEMRGSFLNPAEIRDLLTSTGEMITDTKNGGFSPPGTREPLPGIRKPLIDVYAAFDAIPPLEFVDIGLRVFDGTRTISIACQPEGTLTSPLRIAKNGKIYGIVLVDPADPHASKMIIQTNSGPKALRKF